MTETAYCLAGETTPIAELMDMLGSTRGYKASAIIGDHGESVYTNAIDQVNRENLKNYYGQAIRLSKISGIDSSAGVSLRTRDDVMVILGSARNYLLKIRLIVLISQQADKSLMQTYLRNLLPQIMRSLTWDPDNLVPFYMREVKSRQPITTSARTPRHPKSENMQIDLSILD